MSFSIKYAPLVEVKILHQYFLNDGETLFRNLSESEQAQKLDAYNFEDYLEIVPTPNTLDILKNHKVLFEKNTGGFNLLVRSEVCQRLRRGKLEDVTCTEVQFSIDMALTFEVRYKDSEFDIYTEDILNAENRLCFFSNELPENETSRTFPSFLRREVDHNEYLLKPEDTREFIYKLAQNKDFKIDTKELDAIREIKADALNSDENAGVIDAYVTKEKRNGLVGYIHFIMQGPGSNDDLINILNVQLPQGGKEKKSTLPPTVRDTLIRFENRKTKWRYIDSKADKEYKSKKQQPLTQSGFVALKATDFTPKTPNDFFIRNPRASPLSLEGSTYYSNVIF